MFEEGPTTIFVDPNPRRQPPDRSGEVVRVGALLMLEYWACVDRDPVGKTVRSSAYLEEPNDVHFTSDGDVDVRILNPKR